MKLLLIDTCGPEGTVALADTSLAQKVVASEVLPGRSSSELLVPTVRALMEAQGWALCDLAAIVVVHGPGSFTGVRVGLSAAKGLSEASGVPLVAVSRLALLASVGGGYVALDAGRAEFYYGEYVDGRCVVESLLTREELLAAVGAETVMVCEVRVADALAGSVVRMVAEPVAGDALEIAVRRVEAGSFDDAATVDANYLRRTDVQLFARPVTR
ncbi:tRNA (adenosine(37)-N6)-threonylcarbamoyltransferase complex dimerization subunit type 1 TsaB [Granulicella arctica]|uniref:tRNA threonylcarbamoyladenosine biosynthesis protein TsaB n=1 Tax=Granulicella arctica TaxID=940613 RepID=A0A7Y9PH51_9BACT|nr:tRNA (adenosine(37)-N6)-threonylcarbamoyltransferase complex dimerization subunit type 1 TsaB [Granulicella arctica]NYF79808.1 tRNA threonylcarbamoyladenosine biosynthesis protein TsaB [Granulicella arctica]